MRFRAVLSTAILVFLIAAFFTAPHFVALAHADETGNENPEPVVEEKAATVVEPAVEEKAPEVVAPPMPPPPPLFAQPPAAEPAEPIDESDVIVLNSSNFDSLVVNSKKPWLVEFYAPWCGWCKKLTPIYAKVATALKGTVNVGKVDVPANRDLSKRFDIHGFPTVKFMVDGKMYDYKSERTEEEFVKFANGGYKELTDSLPIPPPPPFWQQMQDELYIKMLPMEKWIEYHIWPFTFITFGVGIFLGMAFSMICCRSKSKPPTDNKKKNE